MHFFFLSWTCIWKIYMVIYLAIKLTLRSQIPLEYLNATENADYNIDQERAPKHCRCVGQNSTWISSTKVENERLEHLFSQNNYSVSFKKSDTNMKSKVIRHCVCLWGYNCRLIQWRRTIYVQQRAVLSHSLVEVSDPSEVGPRFHLRRFWL